MRFLFILLLAACGRDFTPAYLDTADDDGDGILNYLEPETERYQAQYHFPPINGTLSFLSGSQSRRRIIYSFSNRPDLKAQALSLVARGLGGREENHFSEHLTVVLEPRELPLLDQDGNFSLELNYQFQGQQRREHRSLKRQQLINVLQGRERLQLELVSERQQHISARTYRLLLHGPETTGTHYLSHQLPLEEFLQLQGIDVNPVPREELFFLQELKSPPQWFHRQLDANHHVVVHTELESLAREYFNSLTLQRKSITRQDGKPLGSVKLGAAGERTFLRFRSQWVGRRFIQQMRQEKVGEGRESPYYCQFTHQTLAEEVTSWASIAELKSNLVFSSQGEIINEEIFSSLRVKQDQHGPYFELALPQQRGQIEITLTQLGPPEIHVGRIAENRCNNRGRLPISRTFLHHEAKFEVRMEVYVEKPR
jgi:hypothetical protein